MLNFLRRLLGLQIKPSLRAVTEEVRDERNPSILRKLVVQIAESALKGNDFYRFPITEIGGDRAYAQTFVNILKAELMNNFSDEFDVKLEMLHDNIIVEWGDRIVRYTLL